MFFSGQKFGNYTLVRLLGSGCFGEVWLATRQTRFVTTKVAIKLPLREQVDAETIKQEAVVWEQASGHPNVLPLIEADEHDGQILIVSEYAADGTLEDLLEKQGGLLPVKKAVEMAIGIAQGLEFLHSRQVIHRDIKPANILLQGDIPRLTDFGLSRAVSGNSLSMSMSLNGTPYYMSPEAFNRKRNKQTDIWSFGVVLYKMLSGNLPFEGNDVAELYTTIFTRPPAPLPACVPPFLQQIVFKSLAKSPAERYADAAEIRADLMRCLAALSTENLNLHQTDESFTLQTSEPQPFASQTVGISSLRTTKDRVSSTVRKFDRPAPAVLPPAKPKLLNFKYLAAALVFLLVAFGTGFYIISKRVPIPFRQGDKFGYSTWNKKIVIGPKYDLAFPFVNNRAAVALGQRDEIGKFTGRYGFIDYAGREVVPLEYDEAESFSGELAKVAKLDPDGRRKMFGFINQSGAEIIPLIYQDAQSFAEKLAPVRSNDKWGVIDTKGHQVIAFKYDWIDNFSDGLAAFKLENKYGFLDTAGNEVVAPVFDSAERFADGRAPVQKDGKAFFIDRAGRQSLPYNYETADNFSEGFAMVTLKGKSGFIDKNGAEQVPFQYEDGLSFSEGLAAVKLNGKYGFIDRSGALVIPFKYADARSIKNHLALVRTPAGKEFYIGYDQTEFYEP